MTNNIKKIRESKHIKQSVLINKMNCSTMTIYRYEHNIRQPDLDFLRKIASILEVDMADLINSDDDYVEITAFELNENCKDDITRS